MPSIDPSTITGYLSAYAIEADSIAGADGSSVEASGNYAKPTGFTAPTLKHSAVNGRKSLVFGSAHGLLATPPAWTPNPNNSGGSYPVGFSALAVVKPTNLLNLGAVHPYDRRTFVGWRSTADPNGNDTWSMTQGGRISSEFQHNFNSGSWGWDGAAGIGVFSTDAWYVVGVRTDGETMTCWKGLSFDKSDTNTFYGSGYSQFLDGFCLGGDFSRPGARNWAGEIAYFAPFSRALTDNEYLGAAEWLLTRYGLPLRSIAVVPFIGTTGHDLFIKLDSTVTGKPAHIASTPGAIGYRINGGSLVNTVPLHRVTTDFPTRCNLLAIPLPSPVTSSDTVTLTIAPGTVYTTLGPTEEVTDLPVTNHTGQAAILSQTPPPTRPMKVGWNYNIQGAYYTTCEALRNLFKGAAIVGHAGAFDADWNAVTPNQGTYYLIRTGSEDTSVGSGILGDYPGAEFGRYVVQWDGPTGSLLELASYSYDQGQTVITHVPAMDDLGGTTKRRYFDVTLATGLANPRHRPTFILRHASQGHTCTNIVVQLARYEGTPGYVTDQFKAHMTGAASIRYMDAWQTNFPNVGKASEFTPITEATYTRVKTRTVPIAKIESWEGFRYWPTPDRQHWLVTFAEPHGLTNGQGFTIKAIDDQPVPVTLSTGARDLKNFGAPGRKISDTEFVIAEYVGGGTNHSPSTTPFTGSNAVGSIETFSGLPVAILAHIVNDANVPACHVCFPAPLDDAAVTSAAATLAQTLLPGKTLRVEYSNEPWNLSFSQWGIHAAETRARNLTPDGVNNQRTSYGYIARAVEVYDLAVAAWTAQGRSANDVEFVVNSWYAGPGYTQELLSWLGTNRPALHCNWALAPYHLSNALGRQAGVDYASWSLERMMDYQEAWAYAFDSVEDVSGHKAYLDLSGQPYTLTTYENQHAYLGFSPESGTGTMDQKWAAWNREALAVYHHPRMRGITLHQMADTQAAGCDEFVVYGYTSNPGYEYPGHGICIYGDVLGLTAEPGVGDGSDGKPDNRALLVDGQGKPAWVPHLKLTSPRAGARLAWIQTGLTAEWASVTSPRTTPVASIGLTFSEAVTGVDLSDIALTRDGGAVSLAGASISGSGTTYTLSGLSTATTPDGSYVLTLNATGSGITGATNLEANATRSWVMQAPVTPPPSGRAYFGKTPVGYRFSR